MQNPLKTVSTVENYGTMGLYIESPENETYILITEVECRCQKFHRRFTRQDYSCPRFKVACRYVWLTLDCSRELIGRGNLEILKKNQKLVINWHDRHCKCIHSLSWTILFLNCSDPLEGGGTIYSNGFFLFSQFGPIGIFTVESWDWYH